MRAVPAELAVLGALNQQHQTLLAVLAAAVVAAPMRLVLLVCRELGPLLLVALVVAQAAVVLDQPVQVLEMVELAGPLQTAAAAAVAAAARMMASA